MENIDISIFVPIKETGFIAHEEHNVESLYEIEGKFYINHSAYCVFQEGESPDDLKEITIEEALVFFLNTPDVNYDYSIL